MTKTYLIDLDDTLLGNDMDIFIPPYLKLIAGTLKEYATTNEVIQAMMEATQLMMDQDQPNITLKNKFDEYFYPKLGINFDSVQPSLREFYATRYLQLSELTQERAEAKELVDTLKSRGDRIVIATNPLFPDFAVQPRIDWAGFPKDKYDFVYFTLLSRQGITCKGLHLLPLIDMVSSKLGLKGLVINYSTYTTKNHNDKLHNSLLKSIKSSWKKFDSLKCMSAKLTSKEVCAVMKSVKFVLFPNTADASPRLIAESLVRNKPVVVNSSIYGGWKYITDNNGRFFEAPTLKSCFNTKKFDENHVNSLLTSMRYVLKLDQTNIAKEFYDQYGFVNSVQNLAKIINEMTGKKYDAVAFKEWKKPLKKVAIEKGWI